MKKYTELSWRYLLEQRKRTTLTIIGIILSVMLISSVGIIGESIQQGMIQQEVERGGRYHAQLKNLDQQQLHTLKNHVKIETVGVQVPLGGYDAEKQGRSLAMSLEGWDQELLELMQFSLAEGRFPTGTNELALEYWVLEQLGIEKPQLGMKIILPYKWLIQPAEGEFENIFRESEFTLVGILHNHLATKMTGNSVGLVSQETARTLRQGYPVLTNAFIWIREGLPVRETIQEICQQLGLESDDVHVHEYLLQLSTDGSQIYLPVLFIGIIVVLATVIVIYNIFHISLLERIKQFGMLRSIGTTPHQLRGILYREALLLSLIAIPLGLAVGVGLAQVIVGNLSILQNVANDVVISLRVLGLAVVVGVLAVYISVLNPARLAGKISPMEAIRVNSQVLPEGQAKEKPLANLIESVFGITGKLAYKNLWRNKKRSIVTILSMSISCILFIIFSFINQSADFTSIIDRFVHGDFTIQTKRAYQPKDFYSTAVLAELRSLDGVAEVRGIQFLGYGSWLPISEEMISPDFLEEESAYLEQPDEQGNYYVGLDFFGLTEESLEECESILKAGQIDPAQMAREQIALVVERDLMAYDLQVGDRLPVVIRKWDGHQYVIEKELELVVGGILQDYPVHMGSYSIGTGVALHQNIFRELMEIDGYARFEINLTADADREEVKEQLQPIARRGRFGTVVDYEEEKATIQDMKRQMQVLVLCIVAVIAIIGILNIVNTISTNLIIRTTEFGMLRAIGITHQQLKQMIRLEGMFYGLISLIWALPLGTALSYGLYLLFKQEATYMEWAVPWMSLVGITVGTLVLGVLATLIPVQRIGKMDVVDAVRNVE